MTGVDPTYNPVARTRRNDPRDARVIGFTNHGGFNIDCPYITEVGPNFWQGGCDRNLVLPEFITSVLSLYPWQRYKINHEVNLREVLQHDAEDDDPFQVVELAEWVRVEREKGPTLVHCQAGLNRSGRVAAVVLMLDGLTADEAIGTLRDKRSPAVLCNPAFERWLRGLTL